MTITPYAVASGATIAGVSTLVINVGTVVGGTGYSTNAGDTIIVGADTNSAGQTEVSCADSQGNTYVMAVSQSGVRYDSAMFVANTGPGGTGPTVALVAGVDTITVTYSSTVANSRNAAAIAVNGIVSASPVDVAPTPAVNTTGSSTVALASGTLAQPNEVVVSYEINGNSGHGISWSGGFTDLIPGFAPESQQWSSMATQVVTSTASVTAGGTLAASTFSAIMLISLKVNTPSITTSSLPGGTTGTAYSQTLAATAGVTPYTWSVISGSLPSSLTLNSSTGVIAGTPSAAGTYSFTVQVADADGIMATAALSIVVTTVAAFDALPATPTFPAQPLDLRAELLLSDVWTDISDYVFQSDVTIGRGHPDESTTSSPSTLAMTLDNSDGRFSSLNPTGPYYGSLGRNTQIRVSVPEGASYLRSETDQASYASAPDSAGLSITGDTEIQIDVTLDSWNQDTTLAAKWATTSNERSWLLTLNEAGTVSFRWSPDGTKTNSLVAVSTVAVPPPALLRQAIKVWLQVNYSGTTIVTFFTAPTIGGSWTQLGAGVQTSGTTSVFDSTAAVQLGCCTDTDYSAYSGYYGKIHAFQLLSGIGGTVKASPDFTAQAAGTTSFADAQSNTWTVAGTAEVSDRKYRFHGEVAAWPQAWGPVGDGVTVSITAGGLLRRLGQTQAAINSPMYRACTRITGSAAPVAYWPCEDGAKSTQLASGIGGQAMTISGSPNLASDSNFACSSAIPVTNGSTWTGIVPAYSGGTDNVVRFLMDVPSGGDTTNAVIASVYATGVATVSLLELVYTTGGYLTLTGYGPTGGTVFTSGAVAFGLTGQNRISMSLQKTGTFLAAYQIQVYPVGATQGTSYGLAYSGTVGRVSKVVINPLGKAGGLETSAIGHVSVQSTYDSLFDVLGATNAWQGEAAGDRFQRLCEEEGIAFRGRGNMNDTTPMGTQSIETLISLLQECVDADRGIWTEPRQVLGFGYRTRVSLGNQTAAVTLDYNQEHLSGALTPTEDDQTTINDVTVTQTHDGSSSHQVLADGPLSIQAPPNGIGRYDTQIQVNVATDDQLDDVAGWAVNLGTVNEPRYPSIECDLANTELASLYYDIQDMDLGDRLVVVNPPAWLPPGQIDQLIQGVTETLYLKVFRQSWNGVPSLPWNVAYADDVVLGRADTDGSTLAGALTAALNSNPYFQKLIPGAIGGLVQGSLTGWTAYQGSLALDNTLGGEFPWSCVWTSNGASGGALEGTGGRFPVTVGNVYRVSAWVYSSVSTSMKIGVDWQNSGHSYLSTSTSAIAVTANTWTAIGSADLTAPASAAYAYPRVGFNNTPTSGWSIAVQGCIAWQGSVQVVTTDMNSPVWTTSSGDFPFDVSIGGEQVTVTNITGQLLSGDASTFEGGIANWVSAGNDTIAQTSAQAHGGSKSLSMTSVASGDVQASHCAGTNVLTQGMACPAGATVTLSAWLRAAVSARTCEIGAAFYDATGTVLPPGGAVYDGTTITDSTSAWTQVTGTLVAPASSAWCIARVKILAAGAAGEVHYLDDVTMTISNAQAFTITRGANGVIKAQAAGTDVRLFYPSIFSL